MRWKESGRRLPFWDWDWDRDVAHLSHEVRRPLTC